MDVGRRRKSDEEFILQLDAIGCNSIGNGGDDQAADGGQVFWNVDEMSNNEIIIGPYG